MQDFSGGNPCKTARCVGAALNHNRPAFYMVTPKLFEALVEELADRDLIAVARQRLALKDTAVEVDLEQI